MPYPVLPPEPPAIINSLPPEEHSSSVTVAATAIEPAANAASDVSQAGQSTVVGTLAAPTPPETFAPENSAFEEPTPPTAPELAEAATSQAELSSTPIESNAESATALGAPIVVEASEVVEASAAVPTTPASTVPSDQASDSSKHRHSDVHINAAAPALPPRRASSLAADSSPPPKNYPVTSRVEPPAAIAPPAVSGWSIVAVPPVSTSN